MKLNQTPAWFLLLSYMFCVASCNRPPSFLIDDHVEIVIRLKESPETAVGTYIYTLRGHDADGDPLTFGVQKSTDSDVIRIAQNKSTEAIIFLNRELDRETQEEYSLILTLTDGRLGEGNFVTQSFLLLVEDINDNQPIFKPYASVLELSEASPPGILTTLEATDRDEGAYGQVVYYLQEMDGENEVFSVSTLHGKGVVRLTRALDFERQRFYHINVLAVDRAIQGRINTGTAALLIRVEDAEDEPPLFTVNHPVVRIAEDAPIGTTVVSVKAIDGDRGINNRISYKISNNVRNLFEVDKYLGVVRTVKALDREDRSYPNDGTFIMEITATEETEVLPAPSAKTEITIIITDVNDEIPTFRSPFYECEIRENSQENTLVTFLHNAINEVYDHDQGQNGTFELFLDPASDLFEVIPGWAINQATFAIRLKNASLLDYEQLKAINLTVAAQEAGRRSSRTTANVHIAVQDQNDNFPEFSKALYEVYVLENATMGETLLQVVANDIDSGVYGTEGIRYTSLSGSISNQLLLDPFSGAITIESVGDHIFDREVVQKHYLSVEARDNNGRGNRNSVQIVLNVVDVNDNGPKFLQQSYEVRLRENVFDFEAPIVIEARDSDQEGSPNSQVEYTLMGSKFANHFSLDRNTGRLMLVTPVDFESLENSSTETRAISLTVEASDKGTPRQSSRVSLTVYVQDANDHAPRFSRAVYQRTIPEDIGHDVPILQVNAFDDDGSFPNNLVSYRIVDGSEGKFVINSETGDISVASGASLDPSTMGPSGPSFLLRVAAFDGGNGGQQLKGTCVVNVTVQDVNNRPPYFAGNVAVSVKENTPVGEHVYRLMAHDPDETAMLRYYIDESLSEAKNEDGALIKTSDYDYLGAFLLNATGGLLKIAKLLDREKVETIKLSCGVEDIAAEKGKQFATTILTITVLDENDNNPKFRKAFYKQSIAENSVHGVIVGSVVATDADKNKTIRYNLEGDKNVTELLHIDDETGEIVVANRIDHEEHSWLNFSVRATDVGSPPRHTFVEVFVQVLDENDNNPYFVENVSELFVSENASLGAKIATIVAKDLDSGEYGRITYILDRVSAKDKFNIHPEKGILTVAGALDRETHDKYMITIEAWDNYPFGYMNGESRNAFKHIMVHVMDENDNKPVVYKPTGCTTITEYHNIDDPILKVKATDADDPSTGNGLLAFELQDPSGMFHIQQVTSQQAEVYAMRSLQSSYGNYTVLLTVSDMGAVPNRVSEKIDICVSDFNDHAPFFVQPVNNTVMKVFENASVGEIIFRVKAIDEDVGANAVVKYRLKPDLIGNYRKFSIDMDTGDISLVSQLDREVQKIYEIRIEAFDQGIPTSLSSTLDLIVYVRNVNDHEPEFLKREISLNFTEHTAPGLESVRLPDTIDKDEMDADDEPPSTVCYMIVGGNERQLFRLDPMARRLLLEQELDREEQAKHVLLIKATENCAAARPESMERWSKDMKSVLQVTVYVNDINDNAPEFESQLFTGGISTASQYGANIMQLKAHDKDDGVNGAITYYRTGSIRKTLAEGLEELEIEPFLVDEETGHVLLNFYPQKTMRGYFDFSVIANDTDGNYDKAHVFIYLLREDQRVKFILRQNPSELRQSINEFREILSNVSGCIVNIDDIRVHENKDGSVDRTKSDMFMHLVDKKDNSVLEVHEVLQLLDKHVEKLDKLFKEFNVLDTQASRLQHVHDTFTSSLNIIWLLVIIVGLGALLLMTIGLTVSQRQTFQRQLRAAKIASYGTLGSGRMTPGGYGAVPNTNKHSMTGSNPVWIAGNDSDWLKDDFEQCRDNMDTNKFDKAQDSGYLIKNCCQFEGSKAATTSHAIYYHIKGLEDNSNLYAKNLETTEL